MITLAPTGQPTTSRPPADHGTTITTATMPPATRSSNPDGQTIEPPRPRPTTPQP
ncbi:hypothetical protein M2157_005843 [Streptomyces sp. SAI-127]|nr:hypothetical protein [Streptomyces sp. SAI-127]